MTLTQRLNFLIILFAINCANLITNSPAQATEPTKNPQPIVKKTAETAFSDGLNCLKFADITCAQLALVNIPSQSANAKILAGGIAILQGDDDLAFRLLLPLDADSTLQPTARASLHASLSLAYEKLPDMLRTIEQKIIEEQVLIASNTPPFAIQQAHTKLWALINSLSKDQLIELRGASAEANLQGWIDLALTQQNQAGIADWQKAYPDHSANTFATSLLQAVPTIKKDTSQQPLTGKVALLLPQNDEKQAASALALQQGFKASAAIDNSAVSKSPAEINTYATPDNDITSAYDLAINDGANYIVVVGFSNINISHAFSVPTLLISPTAHKPSVSKNLYILSQSLNDEAILLANTANRFGMQNVLIVSQGSSNSDEITAAFNEPWKQIVGKDPSQIKLTDDSNLLDVKAKISAQHTDMILIAGEAVFARKIRPYLDMATPTFGFSTLYEGIQNSALNISLNAIRFTDLPWLLKPSDFHDYQAPAKEAAQDAASQRSFGLGADIYQVLAKLTQEPRQSTSFNGLTGTIHIDEQGEITHVPSLGSFTNNGVILEK